MTAQDTWRAELERLNHERALAVYAHLPTKPLPHGTPESDAALARAMAAPDVLEISQQIQDHVAAYPGDE